ncbi:MAG TPA: RpiB/LacA/LacB family sugar-phosphate isomerase [Bacillota bacterium]|nr:RpiB/LacA/LacB family sugar-phosphate isomerase [Bacillota bacterium]
MKLAIASDLSGFPLKNYLLEHLTENHPDIELLDFGIKSPENPKPFFEQAGKVAKAIQSGAAQQGILVCGTGQGMAIAANKHKGIYAGLVTDPLSGERAKIINNANVITMGCWITAPVMGAQIVDSWLAVSFTEKMDSKKAFIIEAFNQVQQIENEQFK